jgi:hypothetical protein
LQTNDLVIIRNHGDDDEQEWDIKGVLERQEDAHIKVDHFGFILMYKTHTKSDLDVLHMHRKRTI